MLSLFCYMMWDGRRLDEQGQSWVEMHIFLLIAVLAGAVLRALRTRARLRPETRERVMTYSFILFLFLIFTGYMTALCLFMLVVGSKDILASLQSATSLPPKVWLWFFVFVVYVRGASPDPWLVSIGILAFLLSMFKSDEEPPQEERLSRRWAIFWGIVGLFLAAYFLYGQFTNALAMCTSSEVCARYPYSFLQMRCRATCVFAHNFSKDFVFNLAAVGLTRIMMSGANLLAEVLSSVRKKKETDALQER